MTAVLALSATAWMVAVRQMRGMDMGVSTELGSFQFFLAVWVAMMAAMMLPGALPALVDRARSDRPALTVPLFAVSYLAVWTLVGLAVYVLYHPHGTVIAGTLTVAAGLYELTPLKRACRLRCRQYVHSGSRVRALLRRLQHRADARPARYRRDEHHLDVRHRRTSGRSEARAAESLARRTVGSGSRRARDRDRRRAFVDPRNHTGDVNERRQADDGTHRWNT